MAIQNRRGLKVDFDPFKMFPGEFGYALDTAELYYCYSAGNVKKLMTAEDLQTVLNSSAEAYIALQQLITELEDETVLTGILADINNLQNTKLDKTGASNNNTVIFSEATTDVNIASGENHTTLFGKILKSLKTFRTSIATFNTHMSEAVVKDDIKNNVVTTTPNSALDARQGKVLQDQITQVNNNLNAIGTVHSAELINGTYAQNDAVISDAITVPAGTYIVSFTYGSVENVGVIGLTVNNAMEMRGLASKDIPSFTLCLTFEETTTLKMVSGQSASFTIALAERSSLTAVRIK